MTREIHVNRAGETLGQFTLQEVMAGLASGRFLPSDLAWRPGMETWVPLNKFSDLDVRPESQKLADQSPAPLADALPAVAGNGPDWEKRDELGFFNALINTVKGVLMSPSETFSDMRREGGLSSPLLFYSVLAIVAGLVSIGYQAVIEIGMSAAGAGQELAQNPAAAMLGTGVGLGVAAILIPVFAIIGVFIASGINHLMLMLVGAKPRDFETTFRVCAYGYGAANVLQLIPMCGGLISGIWGLVIVIIGLARAHETTTGRAALAVLLPAILCAGIAVIGIFAALAIPAAAMMTDAAASGN